MLRFGHNAVLFCVPALLISASSAFGVSLPACTASARQYMPCELSYEISPKEIASSASFLRDDLVHVEFRSPSHTTYLLQSFWSGGNTLRVRFTPVEAGVWTYRISSTVARYDNQEATFNVAETPAGGMVNVANLRHWRTTDKKPHLWFSATVPWLQLEQSALESWLDARKSDGFSHVAGVLLSGQGAKPFTNDLTPDFAYFDALDGKVLAAADRGFTLDFTVADDSFVRLGLLQQGEKLGPIVRYLAARYGGLNAAWQGFEQFEEIPDGRMLLKNIGQFLKQYDGFRHPRSSGARVTCSPLLADGWMNYLIEASPKPELGAVEHQFTEQPEIHQIKTAEPALFRHELWNATTNGEYVSVTYEALQNVRNVKAVQTWFHILSGTRHWELEPYFDVSGARAVGLEEVEYLTYTDKPGIVEINLPRHKYNPLWINPGTGEEIPLKDYRGEVFSRQTPDNERDWILQVPRDGRKESMAKSYYFESQDPPVQEVETDAAKTPFEIASPPGDEMPVNVPVPYKARITRANRATRHMEYVWWGEVVASGGLPQVLAYGPDGSFTLPKALAIPGASLHVRLLALNANGKAYQLDKVYALR